MPIGSRLPELILLLVIALLIFGPKKLPEIGASIGKSINSFKKGMKEIENSDNEKERIEEQRLLEQKRSELEALERELASKKAAINTYQTSQAEHAEASTTESKHD